MLSRNQAQISNKIVHLRKAAKSGTEFHALGEPHCANMSCNLAAGYFPEKCSDNYYSLKVIV